MLTHAMSSEYKMTEYDKKELKKYEKLKSKDATQKRYSIKTPISPFANFEWDDTFLATVNKLCAIKSVETIMLQSYFGPKSLVKDSYSRDEVCSGSKAFAESLYNFKKPVIPADPFKSRMVVKELDYLSDKVKPAEIVNDNGLNYTKDLGGFYLIAKPIVINNLNFEINIQFSTGDDYTYYKILSKAKDSDLLLVGGNEYHDFKYLSYVMLRNLDAKKDQAVLYSKDILAQASKKYQSYENNMEHDRFTAYGAGNGAFRIFMGAYEKNILRIEYVAPTMSHRVMGKKEEYYKNKDAKDKGMLNSL